LVVICRRFGTTYQSHLQGSSSPRNAAHNIPYVTAYLNVPDMLSGQLHP